MTRSLNVTPKGPFIATQKLDSTRRRVESSYVGEVSIHLDSPERQQQQVKEAPNTQQKQTNKREQKTYAQIGELVNSVTTFIHQRTLKTSVNQR